jgi:hypothetical protein
MTCAAGVAGIDKENFPEPRNLPDDGNEPPFIRIPWQN